MIRNTWGIRDKDYNGKGYIILVHKPDREFGDLYDEYGIMKEHKVITEEFIPELLNESNQVKIGDYLIPNAHDYDLDSYFDVCSLALKLWMIITKERVSKGHKQEEVGVEVRSIE